MYLYPQFGASYPWRAVRESYLVAVEEAGELAVYPLGVLVIRARLQRAGGSTVPYSHRALMARRCDVVITLQ
jgi:hypothetical protein